MSHFSQIKTQIRDLDCLKAALTDLDISWKSGDQPIQGYNGQTCQAEVAISQTNGHEIGFSWNGQAYELVADLQFWQQAVPVDLFLRKVTQRYAYNAVMNQTAQQGFQLAEQQNNQDGSIRLVLQRWSA